MILLISVLASVAAFAGGYIALRFRDKLHIILGLSAGAVIGAALFDLIPESIELAAGFLSPEKMTALTGLGFLVYLVLDRIFSFHDHNDDEGESHTAANLGAASFSLHSLIDGIAIGLAFQAGEAIGTIVAVAVIAHRFSDGINTIGIILRHDGGYKQAWGWLVAVAVAPIIGAALTYLVTVSPQNLAILLAVFAGFFLYIGASDLIPEGHHSHSRILTTVMTLVGAGILYTIVSIAHS
jgi:zinc transporter ZupT